MIGVKDHRSTIILFSTRAGASGGRSTCFLRSRHTRRSGLSLHQIATTRNTQFGTRDPPLLTGHSFQSKEVHAFIQYIYQLIRADAFDDTVLEKLIDDEAMGVLTLLFKTSEVSTTTPAPNGWALDWDVATIIVALEECYLLLPEQKYLDLVGCS